MNYSCLMWQMAAALLPWSWSLRHKQGSECSGWWTFWFNMLRLCKSYGVSQSSHHCLYLHRCNFLHREAVTSFGPHMSQTHVWDVMLAFVPWSQHILHFKASIGTEIPQLSSTLYRSPQYPTASSQAYINFNQIINKMKFKTVVDIPGPSEDNRGSPWVHNPVYRTAGLGRKAKPPQRDWPEPALLLCPEPTATSQARPPPLSLGHLICKVRIATVPTLQSFC